MHMNVTIQDRLDEIEFVKRAIEVFDGDLDIATFSLACLEPGCLLAIRWGLLDDCVMVVRLHDEYVPTNYTNVLERRGAKDGG